MVRLSHAPQPPMTDHADPAYDRSSGLGPSAESRQIVLSAQGLEKSYPGTRALAGVDLELVAGEVHGLVGENGAGKSTLVKILSGAVAPDRGTLRVFHRRIDRFGPRAAHRIGIAVVHQEPNIVPALDPVANVFLGQTRSKAGFLREGEMRRRVLQWTTDLGTDLPTRGEAGALSVADQQMIEIIRAMEHGARIVMLDEPTASLGAKEREGLFAVLEVMKRRGTAVVFISHKLDDVLRVADVVTVLRDGERVLTTPAGGISPEGLVQAMLGKQLQSDLTGRSRRPAPQTQPTATEILRIRSLDVPGVLSSVELSVKAGEILAIAGLVGSGRSTILRAIGGAEPTCEGEMSVGGRPVVWPRTPRHAHRLGIALAPEDRRTEGLVMSLTSAENLLLASLSRRGRWGFSTRKTLVEAAAVEAGKVGYPAERLHVAAGHLSGGNQQKLVLGKFLPRRPAVLLVDEPTRGIDVGAKSEIFRLLQLLAGQGTAIVVVSEELEELVALADRIVVLSQGVVSDEMSGAEIDATRILTKMMPTGRGHVAAVAS